MPAAGTPVRGTRPGVSQNASHGDPLFMQTNFTRGMPAARTPVRGTRPGVWQDASHENGRGIEQGRLTGERVRESVLIRRIVKGTRSVILRNACFRDE